MLSSKLPNAGTTIFTTMSALAAEHSAINLSQGFPDYDCDPALIALANKYLGSGFNQYAPMAGTLKLRETICNIVKDCYNADIDPATEVTVTAGGTQAIYTALAAILHPGDEVIVLEPAYDCYVPAILVHGATPVYARLRSPDFSIDWDEVSSLIGKRTRAIMINSPHNPSGAIIDKRDIGHLAALAEKHDLIVISDEVYEHMVYVGRKHLSVLTDPALARRSFVISSFGKTVHATGWKIGYAIAPEPLMKEFRKVHQFLVFVVNHPLQLALADYLSDPSHYRGLSAFYQRKRDLFLSLTAPSRLKPLPCSGTYFQLMSFRDVFDESDDQLAIRLTKEKKLACIPLSAFYHDKHDDKLLRFCFAKKDETLEKAAAIINAL